MTQDAQEKLITAATELFARQGYAGTSTRDIVKAAGLNISLITYHFGGKEGLLAACLSRAAETVFGQALTMLKPPANARDFVVSLTEFATAFLEIHAKHPYFFRLVQSEMDRQSPAFGDVVRSRYFGYLTQFIGFFQEAQKSGVVRRDAKPEALAVALHGTLIQNVRLDPFRKQFGRGSLSEKNTRAEIVGALVDCFCQGALPRQ